MAGAIESTAFFEQKAAAVGLTMPEVSAAKAAGGAILAKLAFGSSYQPGAKDETPFIAVLSAILGASPTGTQAVGFRRLLFEACGARHQTT